jgi:3-hydroxyacyl-CoA dehydrogenase
MKVQETAKDDGAIAVIGCGVIGTRRAALFRSCGHTVRLWDAAPRWPQRFDAPIAAAKSPRDLGINGEGASYMAKRWKPPLPELGG